MSAIDRKGRRPVLEWGLVISLCLAILIFELYPTSEACGLSARVTGKAHMASHAILIHEQHEELADDSLRYFIVIFPVCTYRPDPEYPDSAREAGIEGDVTVNIRINDNGTVEDVIVNQSSGSDILDQAAVSSAWATEWTPAQNNYGAGVDVWTSIKYSFPRQ